MERIEFKRYAGFRVNGKVSMPMLPFRATHLDKVSHLTAQVESGGKYGTVISYDGTGMTAGIHQAVAVYPASISDGNPDNDQGPLWSLLYDLKCLWESFAEAPTSTPMVAWPSFENYLNTEGFTLTRNGLFYTFTKKKVPGTAIRQFFTGSPDGVVPVSGAARTKAEFWAKLFHDLFSSEWTFQAQLEFGDKYFEDGSEKRLRFCKDRALQDKTIRTFIYGGKPLLEVSSEDIGDQLDLAMAIYWSNSVNAPGYALKLLCKVADNHLVAKDDFPKALISVLGNTSFGRWDDDIADGRYQRTRSIALKMWPEELFRGPKAIMPKTLTGGRYLS